MDYDELKKCFKYTKDNAIEVDRKFVQKFQLSIWDLREIVRLIECIDNYTETTTINKRVADLLKSCGVILIKDKVGWTL